MPRKEAMQTKNNTFKLRIAYCLSYTCEVDSRFELNLNRTTKSFFFSERWILQMAQQFKLREQFLSCRKVFCFFGKFSLFLNLFTIHRGRRNKSKQKTKSAWYCRAREHSLLLNGLRASKSFSLGWQGVERKRVIHINRARKERDFVACLVSRREALPKVIIH